MKELSRITVGELNVQGEKLKDGEKLRDFKDQIGRAFKLLKKAPANKEQNDQEISEGLDVIVLTAVRDAQWEAIEKLDGYEWIVSKPANKYSVVIGVKKSLLDRVLEKMPDEGDGHIDLLSVRCALNNGKTLVVIGCRMTTGKSNWGEQYESEKKAFYNRLVPFIRDHMDGDICIVAGDFNNAQCYGDLTKKYSREDYLDKYGKELSQINYNLNVIHDTFEAMGFEMADIGKNGQGIGTLWSRKYHCYNIPDDHIFVRGSNLQVKKCDIVPTTDVSDHAIIWAELELDAGER